MTRRKKKRRRRKSLKFKLKSETIYALFQLGFLFGAALVLLSFSRRGPILSTVSDYLTRFFGWGTIFLPVILILFSLLFLASWKSKWTKPNVSLGAVIFWICFLALGRSGEAGRFIWNEVALLITGAGSFFIFFGGLVVGLVVFFNTSLDSMIEYAIEFGNFMGNFFAKVFGGFSKKGGIMIKGRPILEKGMGRQISLELAKKGEEKAGAREGRLEEKVLANVGMKQVVWTPPPISLLSEKLGGEADRGDLRKNAEIIEKTLDSFGINARVAEVNLGPAVTQYALELAMGTKLSKVTALSNDLAMALAAPSGQIRIEAPIPGRNLVGVEVPNRSLEFVTMRTMLTSDVMKKEKSKLAVALGLDVSGKPILADIYKMPHVLIAGTTGSGKSVLLNSFISSILFRTEPSEVRLILIDPKRVELTLYNGTPHLYTSVIVDIDKILSALKWAVREMDRRYKLFAAAGVRNIDGYNRASGITTLPYIVIMVDELADLMAFAPVEVEDSICRLAQMARATGVHLIISTQRPSVDVITGLIKANIPCRIAFNVSSMVDSRVILDMPGAEKLLGRGDMLYIPPDRAKPIRIQGTFISEAEVKKVVEYLKKQEGQVEYTEEVTSVPVTLKKRGKMVMATADGEEKDSFFDEAIRVVCQHDKASASLLQRRLSIGYARAARILDQLEASGVVGPPEGSKPREVLVRNPAEVTSIEEEKE